MDFVTEVYGAVMGCKCDDIFNDAPFGESGFADSIRRSLTRELDALIQRGKYQEAMRDV